MSFWLDIHVKAQCDSSAREGRFDTTKHELRD